MQFFLASHHFIHLKDKYSPKHNVIEYSQSVIFYYGDRPSSIPYKIRGKIVVLYTSISNFMI
jgi:hypothetical protein